MAEKKKPIEVQITRRCRGPEGVLMPGRKYTLPYETSIDLLRMGKAIDPKGEIVVPQPTDPMRGKDTSKEQPGGSGEVWPDGVPPRGSAAATATAKK